MVEGSGCLSVRIVDDSRKYVDVSEGRGLIETSQKEASGRESVKYD